MAQEQQNLKKIMVVDDDTDMLALIRTYLAKDYILLEASKAEDALKIVAEKPDLIITDVLMPKMTGYEFLKELKKSHPHASKIPMIVMSSRETMREYFDVWDIVSFLKKPFTREALQTIITQALNVGGPVKVAQTRQKPKIEEKPLAVARRVIISGVDHAVMQELKNFLLSVNCKVELGVDETDVINLALKSNPDAIFCQLWEDLRILDAFALNTQILSNKDIQNIPYAAFCTPALSVQASRSLPRRKVIIYENLTDLLKKIYEFLKRLN